MKTNAKEKYSGVIVPMATPFTEQGEVDLSAARRIIDHLCEGGVSGVFVLGTTGESVSIAQSEKEKLVDTVANHTNGRAVVYAGISDTCFAQSVQAGRSYLESGADAVVAHLPWYYPLDGGEMCSYFSKLAEEVQGALMLYNIPKTTHMSIPVEVVEKLSTHRNIVGLKDSEKNPERMEEIIGMLSGRDDFSFAVGCAPLSSQAARLGADAIVPSSGNLVPKMYKDLFDNARQSNDSVAENLQEQTNMVSAIYQKGRSLGQSLAALKTMMSVLGLCSRMVLPPLEMLSDHQRAEIEEQMKSEGVFQPISGAAEK
ncbi:dihydrodipicolinate synthase family protein [Sedimentisphaera salicampi]|uniref:4-hydroxy-tetrahydrodipicolinate synthase n=1 Tax=Sedimentisphaera salicampi TaxID=1941349 RepID=A0A1W6LLS8_9BACT|nr:dihydrodipicolinate synthase family protein [Sedimentisphaera salicampi]ARN56729.1 4-hydroxy-tetrahydrodipicolinate synthase [Sedimentisphaera salicampi]